MSTSRRCRRCHGDQGAERGSADITAEAPTDVFFKVCVEWLGGLGYHMRTKSVRLCNGRLRISTWRLQLSLSPPTHGDACLTSDHVDALDALPISIAHNTPQILSTSCWTCNSIYPSRHAALLSYPSRQTRCSASHSPVAADRQRSASGATNGTYLDASNSTPPSRCP